MNEQHEPDVCPIDQKFLDLFVCPVTKQPLHYENGELINQNCTFAYAVKNGIPILLEEEARPLKY